ncbi:hypothetical protein ACO0LF_09220 [Undibacterium sp. Di27W]|uniref:hypothetical protein n=1 Tax=Undibacterium sp. Di27W TaxID=3413036 RepID=UPI003BF070F5
MLSLILFSLFQHYFLPEDVHGWANRLSQNLQASFHHPCDCSQAVSAKEVEDSELNKEADLLTMACKVSLGAF